MRNSRRVGARLKRRLRSEGPTVHYFHQVTDPFSHLAVQTLDRFSARYRVDVKTHLVPATETAYAGDAERFEPWQRTDACDIAPFYGLDPTSSEAPEGQAIAQVEALLAGQTTAAGFAAVAVEAGHSLWQGRQPAVADVEPASKEATAAALQAGKALRTRLGHYYSAMFWFDGEWFWGVDRLCHLERRLIDEGLSRAPDAPLCVPRPVPPPAVAPHHADVTLEYFPSLRSPYTAISFRRTMAMVDRLGVRLSLRPVMPMMMRGVPAPAAKGMYILADTAREAAFYGDRFGHMVDPFGEPVRTAFSLFPWALEQGKGREYLQSYLDAAFADGIDITSQRGLAKVVERAGLSFAQASSHLNNPTWEAVLESNVQDMLTAGLWGVPSFRVSGGGRPPFSCWGQDRLWRVETEIIRRARA